MQTEYDVLFSEKTGAGGNIGEILLNRPKALNALTPKMCQDLSEQLMKWGRQENIKAIIIKGAGEKAFCAGGDIRQLYDNRQQQLIENSDSFMHTEYALNKQLYHFHKPFISFLNGITMGGGAGVSIHGSHRIATEKFIFAMPEVNIGFFPDIGACYFLNQSPGKMGWYLALSGKKILAEDAYQLGLVTHTTSSDQLVEIENALLHTHFSSHDFNVVDELLNQHAFTINESQIASLQTQIDSCFNKDSVEDIFKALKEINSPFFVELSNHLQQVSPLSLKVTFEHLRRSAAMNFDEVIQADFHIVRHFLRGHDLYEGIRALLIEKDQTPHWQPKTLQEITKEMVLAYFESSQ